MKKPPVHKPNYFYTILSVTLVLFLLGLFGIIVVQGQQMLRILREQVEVIIELKEDSTAPQVDSLKQHLQASNYFKPNSTKFIVEQIAALIPDRLTADDEAREPESQVA